jgi:hypothetical protein
MSIILLVVVLLMMTLLMCKDSSYDHFHEIKEQYDIVAVHEDAKKKYNDIYNIIQNNTPEQLEYNYITKINTCVVISSPENTDKLAELVKLLKVLSCLTHGLTLVRAMKYFGVTDSTIATVEKSCVEKVDDKISTEREESEFKFIESRVKELFGNVNLVARIMDLYSSFRCRKVMAILTKFMSDNKINKDRAEEFLQTYYKDC